MAAISYVMTLVFLGSLALPALFAGIVTLAGYGAVLLTVAVATVVAAVYVYLRLSPSVGGG